MCHTKVKIGSVDWSFNLELRRFNNVCNLFYEVADLVADSGEKYNMVTTIIDDIKINK